MGITDIEKILTFDDLAQGHDLTFTATGVSDGRYFADDGIEIINFGPGSGVQGHAANESVPVAEMVLAARIQLGVANRILGIR